MIQKIAQKIETSNWNNHKLITKVFQRGHETIETKSAYINDELYNRNWVKSSYKKREVINQSYYKGKPIKGSRLDIKA